MGMKFFLQKEQKIPGAHRIGTAISGPRIACGKCYGHRALSDRKSPLRCSAFFIAMIICALTTEIHCNAGHDANSTANAMLRSEFSQVPLAHFRHAIGNKLLAVHKYPSGVETQTAIYRSLRALGPKTTKKSQKSLPRPSGPECPKSLGKGRIVLESWPPATGLRKPTSPKALGRVLGFPEECREKPALQGGTAGSSAGRPFSFEKQENGTAPSSPPSNALFPGALPSTLPGTFGDLGFLSPVAGSQDSKDSLEICVKTCKLFFFFRGIHFLKTTITIAF